MHFDVAIAGLGGMGSAAAAHCAKRGARTIGFDRFPRGHAFSSSSGRSRLIRKAYFEQPAYVPLLQRAYELWHKLEGECGQQLLCQTGLLTVGQENSPVMTGTMRAATEYDLEVEFLDHSGLRKRYPGLRVEPGEVAVHETKAGMLNPEAAMTAHLQMAERAGATLRFGESVSRWSAVGNELEVTTSSGEKITCTKLVLTTGAWLRDVFAALGVQLQIQRNVQAWFLPATSHYEVGRFPCFLVERETWPAPLYGFPDFGSGVKAAFHGHGSIVDPDDVSQEIEYEKDIGPLQKAMNSWMPGAAHKFREAKPCRYSLTPDLHFVLDRLDDSNVVLCGGFSGHGFKFAPLIGEIAADLALEGETAHRIEFLSLRRFQ